MEPRTSMTSDSDKSGSSHHFQVQQPNTEQRDYQSGSTLRKLDYSDAKTMVAYGPHVLYDHVATSLETALRRSLPQMEVRFSNVSLTAEITVASEATREERTPELPTIDNELKKGIAALTAKKIVVYKEILKNVSGVFKPGTTTLILGQPGSGKSALMKILSGRFPMTRNITVEGEILYNGQAQQEFKSRLPQFVTYVNQHDVHYPMLTVKETLEFAHAFSGGDFLRRGDELLANGTSDENRTALEAVGAMFSYYPELIIEQLGLQNCQDTIVGDAMLRGVSGGERKRVTVGEMEFGMKYVTLMDEISTGLDSAATFDIIKTQRSIAKKFRKTVVIALLQPAPEVFELFDDVMILNEGEVMYHGPREQVVDYFKDLGFVCPPERDIADYLLDLGTKQQHKYAVGASLTQAKLPRSPSEFAEAFRQSAIHASMLRDLNEPHSSELLANVGAHMEPMPKFHQSFWENTWTLIRRESMVTMRNTPALMGRAVMVILMGLINSTMFFQLNPTQVQVVMGIVFATVLFLSLSQMALIPTNLAARTIFYKQRHANFYRTSSYVLANSISQLPLIMIETIAFGTMVYWMCGFHSSASSYLIFEVVLFLTNVAFGAWFFFVAVASPNIHLANSIASVSVLLFILFAGFVVLKSQIPDYFIWLYWLSPITWGIRAIAINEYRSDTYDVCDYDGVAYCEQFGGMTMGEYYLSLYDIESKKEWIAYGMIYLVLVYLVFMGLSSLWLEYIRYESPEDVYVMATKDIEEHPGYALAETPKASSKSTSYELNEKIVVAVQPSTNSSIIPVTVAFCDLWYSVPSPSNPKESIDLLKGITGFALPGTITALMGSSGAGKTTLMDVIAGRKTGGKIRGQILLNGHAATDLAIRRCTGYCEQMDIHSESSTIREALTFSAFLRQDSSVPDSQKYDSVNECLDLLDMHDIADQIIRGRSVEQMKRLTIGVELAAQPSVLFLDEPTSGLDARSAKLIMDGVRKVANSGRTIVCTIHQPSSEVFFLFDRLLLLKRGGETVFFGDLGVGCHNLVNYFEAIPGIASLPEGYNPATWMLECIGAGVSNGAGNDMDFAKCFNESEQKRMLDSKIMTEGIGHPAQGNSALAFSKKRAASSMTQMTFVVSRFMTMYWRTSAYNLTRMLLSLVVALLFGLMFTKADYASYQGTVSGAGMLYEVVIFNGLMSFESILPIISHERASFYRERASQTYNAFWYFVGSTIAEIPYVLASTLIFTVVFFPMVGFTGFWTGVLFWINLSLLVLCHAYLGQLFAFAFPSEEVATILGVLVMSIFFLLMGFSPPTSAIPAGLKWIHYITPHTYSLSIFVALVFADCPQNTTFDSGLRQFTHLGSALGCQPLKNAPVTLNQVTVKQFTEDVFDMKHDDISTNFVILIGIIVLLRLLALLSLRFVNHQKK